MNCATLFFFHEKLEQNKTALQKAYNKLTSSGQIVHKNKRMLSQIYFMAGETDSKDSNFSAEIIFKGDTFIIVYRGKPPERPPEPCNNMEVLKKFYPKGIPTNEDDRPRCLLCYKDPQTKEEKRGCLREWGMEQ